MLVRPTLRFRSNQSGSTAVEFAIVAPVLILFLVGSFDIAHTLYMKSVLQGIVQKAGRDSSLRDASAVSAQTAIDQKVASQVRLLHNAATVTFSRRFFENYTKAANRQPEAWTDTNVNKKCDAGEPYVDSNANSSWDADGGSAGQGGAKDRVVYNVVVKYRSLLPFSKLISGSADKELTATTVLQNQPYSDQDVKTGTAVRFCA